MIPASAFTDQKGKSQFSLGVFNCQLMMALLLSVLNTHRSYFQYRKESLSQLVLLRPSDVGVATLLFV